MFQIHTPPDNYQTEGEVKPLSYSNWSLYDDPISQRQKELFDRHFVNPTISKISDVDLRLTDFRTDVLNLKPLHFTNPTSVSDRDSLTKNLLALNGMCRAATKFLRDNSEHQLTLAQRRELQRVRLELMEVLYDSENDLLVAPVRFNIHYTDKINRLDINVFRSILQCSRCLITDQTRRTSVATLTCSDPAFANLVKHNIIYPRLDKKTPILNFNVPELFKATVYLEKIWFCIPYFPETSIFLDLLLARLSVFILEKQPINLYGELGNFRTAIGDSGLAQATRAMSEDFCWSTIPMYKRFALCETLRPQLTFDHEILDSEAENMATFLAGFLRSTRRATLQPKYQTAYFNFSLLPSERRRFIRDHPYSSPSNGQVFALMREDGEKDRLMEILAKVPWLILEGKLFPENELGVLYLCAMNEYMNTKVSSSLNWMAYCVHFNFELLKNSRPLEFLTRDYPVIVQHFNGFGVFYNGLYEHKTALHAILHWISIVFMPPFNEQIVINNKTFNCTLLNSFVPTHVKPFTMASKPKAGFGKRRTSQRT